MGLAAEFAVINRTSSQSAIDILDRVCEPWRNCDAEFEASDPNAPYHIRPDYDRYTDPHPKAALGMLMVEAFAPNGLEDLPRYQYMLPRTRDPKEPYDPDRDQATVDAWYRDVGDPFKSRYDFW